MVEQFKQYIAKNNLFDSSSRLLVAVSGGLDSVTLCSLLQQAGFNFSIAHCNFQLRGEESDQDELFVKKLAKRYKVPIYLKNFQTEEFARAEGISVQMAARDLRYTWFQTLAEQEKFDRILTAHHQNDLAETILLNLVRGTGIAGLHGIKALSGIIARPMLFVKRDKILEYVEEKQLTWREDSSNQETKYSRNLIRQEVIPILKKINPNFEETLSETAERIAAAETIYLSSIEKIKERIISKQNNYPLINIPLLRKEQEIPGILYEILKPFHFNFYQVKNIAASLDSEPGKKFHSSTHHLFKDRDSFIITPKDLSSFSSAIIENDSAPFVYGDHKITFKKLSPHRYKIKSDKSIACLDSSKVQFPLEIRKWKEGDWFCPLGMNKKKKISDFLIDQKVPLPEKETVHVLLSAGTIVWIVGHRIDDRFKLKDSTTEILEISVSQP